MLDKTVIASVVLFVVSVALCLLPRFLVKTKAIGRVYPFIVIFTAGVQMATILVDLIPHMVAHGHHHHHHHNETAPFTAIGGVIIILLALDTLFLHGDSASSTKSETHTRTHDHSHEHAHEHSHECSHGQENLGTCNTSAISKSRGRTQALVTLFAISAHSFFEGLSVNEKNFASTLAVGLYVHKILESFSLGVAILASPFGRLARLSMVLFYSLLTPVGIVFASAMNKEYPSLGIWFNALSLGAMMFVVFVEMIAHSFHDGKHGNYKIAMIMLGYSVGCIAINQAHCH